MPARVLVFCKQPIVGVTAAEVITELRDADLMTLAEVHDLPGGEEAAVKAMWNVFRIEDGQPTINGASIVWHADQRPIQVAFGPPLDGELAETLENFDDDEGPGPDRVRAHVAATVSILNLEMGITGSNDLAATISEVVAFYIAERFDGIVWFFYDEFAAPDDRGATLWDTRS
ncbi:MAG TPA: hypothetical protein VIV11_37005 [Kofleriaceae bacterium]